MPKNSKRKKDRVADFTKAKLKLGKGKAQSSNAVDTSFKARSIALPTQSITVEKDSSEPLTKRHLTFSDLISHLKHYNGRTRRGELVARLLLGLIFVKDAILGLQELLDSNWQLINSRLTSLLSALVRLIGDEDASVRKQLISFFAWLLPKIPRDDLIPHSALLVLFTTSAQTHIFPEIRIDAIRILDILLEYIPEAVTAGWSDRNERHGSRVLGGYLGILNAGTRYGDGDGATSVVSVVLTLASRLTVLGSLASFLRISLSSLEGTTAAQDDNNKPLNAWFLSGGFSSPAAFREYDRLFTPKHQSSEPQSIYRHWQERVDPDDEEGDQFVNCFPLLQETIGEPWTLNDLSFLDLNGLSGSEEHWSSQLSRPEFVAHLSGTLHSTIIGTYLDCAPSVFSPGSSPSETELHLVLTVIQIARCLYRYMIQSLPDINTLQIDHIREIVNHMTPYFPASNGRDTKTEQAFEEFNLSFCALTSLLLKASEVSLPSSLRSTQARRHPKRKVSSFFPVQTTRVTEYIARRLSTSVVSSSGIAVPVTPIAYVTLLPSIWTFISNSTPVNGKGNDKGKPHESDDLLHAVLDHAVKVPSKSPCKRATVEFVGKLFLLDTSPCYLGPNLMLLEGNHDLSLQVKLEAWLLHLPQVLWELGSSNIPLTEAILRVLLRTLQRCFNQFPLSLNSASSSSINAADAQSQNDATNTSMISYRTLTSLESRLVPYFFINHPTHGALAGPFRKLSNSSSSSSRTSTPLVGFLALDVAATLLGLDKTGGEAEMLERAVSLSLGAVSPAPEKNTMATEMKKYWEDALLMMRGQTAR